MKLPYLVAAMALLVGPVSAHAGSVTEQPNGVIALAVPYEDLNLTTPTGARSMLQRVRDASGRICRASSPSTLPELGGTRSFSACVRSTMDQAIASLDQPTVTAIWRGDYQPRASR